MSKRKSKSRISREARRMFLEHILRHDGCATRRHWAAGELGKLWAEEALEEIAARIAAIP